ncbi:hypothetical protein L7F22_034479 [Adiantum nelumboides]|nr:hypothetical protein [Adiantum nelumboides]
MGNRPASAQRPATLPASSNEVPKCSSPVKAVHSADNRETPPSTSFGTRKQSSGPSMSSNSYTTSLSEFLQKFREDGDNQTATFLPDNNNLTHSVRDIADAEKHDLINLLFKWSTDDILNEDLLKSKVSMIPERFTSLSQYFNSFKWPLLEEVRALLKQSLEDIDEAPYVPQPGEGRTKNFTELVVCLDCKNAKQFKFKPKDLVLLSSTHPGSSDAKLSCYSGRNSLMAFVTQTQENELEDVQAVSQFDSSRPFVYRILVKKPIKDTLYQELMDTKRTWYIIYLAGLATPWRTWEALHPIDGNERNCPIIKETLEYDAAQDLSLHNQELKAIIASYCSFMQLNESQANAVTTVLCDVKAGRNPGVRLIQGPPGTGKTKTIATLLSLATSSGMKCLAVCPTNTAIATVALRLVETLQSRSRKRFGELENSTTETDHEVLGKRDVVLIGSEDKLPLQGLLKDVYLPQRVKRIQLAIRSWRKAAVNMLIGCQRLEEADDRQAILDFPSSELRELLKNLEEHSNTLAEDMPASHAEMFSTPTAVAIECMKSDFKLQVSETAASNWPAVRHGLMNLSDKLQSCLKAQCPDLLSRNSIENLCLQSASLIFCTVSTAGRTCVKQAAPFKCLIIDEAAQLVEAETAIVTSLPGLKHAILVGDHHQLPATIISKTATDVAYGRSLFQRMMSLGHPCLFLKIQYRMHPSISLFPCSTFYKGRLLDGENVLGNAYKVYEQLPYGPYAFIDASDGNEQIGDNGKSMKNLVEASVILAIMRTCLEKNSSSLTVGIITPYSSQRDYLRQCFLKQRTNPLMVEVNSVDGFQGQEKDIIILSTVRANKSGAIGFMKDYRRLNVAITRARYCLWIVGCSKTLLARQNVWTLLLQDVTCRGLLRRVGEDDKLAKAVIKAKADLGEYFDFLEMGSAFFSNMLWKVIFSNNFKNALLEINSFDKRQKILYKIRRLALGNHGSRHKIAKDELKDLVEVHMVAGLCLIWSIDVQRDLPVQQIIKVWDLIDLAKLSEYLKRLQSAFSVYSEGYTARCKTRQFTWLDTCIRLLNFNPFTVLKDKARMQPATWKQNCDFVWLKPHGKCGEQQCCGRPDSITERSTVNESLLLMKFYALSSGIAKNLVTANNGVEINLPFEVNEETSVIIKQSSSCFIQGRSGTGKTTVLVTKLIQREQQCQISQHGFNSSELSQGVLDESNIAEGHIKQIFVTLSPLLCSAIKKQISQLQSALSVEGEGKDSENQLLLDSEDEDKILGNLPDHFIDIPQTYYPMILTFRRFLKMLSNTLSCGFPENLKSSSAKRSEVDYERFDSEYWLHMDQRLTRMFDSCTVYTEITSVIKGSIQAVKAKQGCLSKDMYISLNCKGQHLSQDEKEAIYRLFLQYEKLKSRRKSCDMADQVKHVYRHLALGEYHGDKIDFVYVDEVQDLSPAQISLFSFLCSNPKEGYIFAGDTAQTIAPGIAFRFQEARSLFYTDFRTAAWMGAEHVSEKRGKGIIPGFFRLTHNFRTHIGVVNMANSIVRLLYYFFPQNIDKLDPETSLVRGQLPVLLKSNGLDLAKKILQPSCLASNQGNGFGAQQVILVRDEAQKTDLIGKIGKQGLILTINSFKGLEFEDVLLYNFFTGSSLQRSWKVIYEYMYENKLLTPEEPSTRSHPAFDMTRHSLLCSELKHLYVAVTRARQRLWIYEEDEVCRPMIDYWISQDLLETKLLDESFISQMASHSTPDEWKKRGFEVFNQQQYDMAILCFERARDQHHADLAKAASLRTTGERQFNIDRDTAIANLQEASKMFLALQRPESAAKCYMASPLLTTNFPMGIIYSQDCKPPRFEEGGDCFVEARSWLEAANAYFEGRCVRKCLNVCLLAKQFEKGLTFVKQWTEQASTRAFEKDMIKERCTDVEHMNVYLQKCAEMYYRQHKMYYRQHKLGSMMLFVNAFFSIESKRTFLREKGCLAELISVEEDAKNYLQAAELAELTGDFLRKAQLLEKAGEFNNAVHSLIFLIRKIACWDDQRRGWPFHRVEKPKDLFQKLQKLAVLAEDSVQRDIQQEIPLLFDQVQDLKDVIACAQSSHSVKIKLFATWKAIDEHSKILGVTQPTKGENMDSVENFRAKNATLLSFVNMWIQCQNIVLHCKEAVLENNQDKTTREFCYEFFAVTQDKEAQKIVVHNHEAYWFRGHKRARAPIKISHKEFSDLTARFWDEQVTETTKSIIKTTSNYFASQRESLQLFGIDEKINLLLDLAGATSMLEASLHPSQNVQAFIDTLQREIQTLLWPPLRQINQMLSVQKLRTSMRVVAFLDMIANYCTGINKRPYTIEMTASWQLMFPFLSEEWKSNNLNSLVRNLAFWKDVNMWPSNVLGNAELSVSEFVVKFGDGLLSIYNLAWRSVEDYIRPLTFVTLLEKAAVMACACETLMHGMFIPLTMAVDFMCGEGIDRRPLSSNNVTHQKLIRRFAETALQLLRQAEVKSWFEHVEANRKAEFPLMVQRLFTLLVMVCINTREPSLRAYIMHHLQQNFESENNIMQYLPEVCKVEIGRGCCAFYPGGIRDDEQMTDLKDVFAKVLLSMGDTLIMTRQCRNACCGRPQEGIETVDLEADTSTLDQLTAIAGIALFDNSYTSVTACSTPTGHGETNDPELHDQSKTAREKSCTKEQSCTKEHIYNDYFKKEA